MRQERGRACLWEIHPKTTTVKQLWISSALELLLKPWDGLINHMQNLLVLVLRHDATSSTWLLSDASTVKETDSLNFLPHAIMGRFILFQAQGGIEGCEWGWAQLKAFIVTPAKLLRSSAYSSWLFVWDLFLVSCTNFTENISTEAYLILAHFFIPMQASSSHTVKARGRNPL